jgi:polyisoprenoid-binding protein YceI
VVLTSSHWIERNGRKCLEFSKGLDMQANPQKNVPAMERSVWHLDPEHTSVEFSVKTFFVFTVRGRLAVVDGNIVLDETNIGQSSVEATVKSGSVDTGNKRRDAYFRSASLLDASQYPDIEFRSSSVAPGKDRDTFLVDGSLTIKGHTRTVQFNVDQFDRSRSPNGEEVIYYLATTEIDRSAFGIHGGRRLIGRSVKAWINVQANRR